MNGYHYDVNSLYPFVMRAYKYPIGEYEIATKIKRKHFIRCIQNMEEEEEY